MLKLALSAAVLVLAVSETRQPPTAPPTALAIIACRVDDLTGQPGRQDPEMAARGWRDLELHIKDGELQCKREVVDLIDQVQIIGPEHSFPLSPNFSEWSQCAGVAMAYAPLWNEHHQGWAVIAAGCPTPIVDGDGKILSYKLPECPTYLPGTTSRMTCRFDGSAV